MYAGAMDVPANNTSTVDIIMRLSLTTWTRVVGATILTDTFSSPSFWMLESPSGQRLETLIH